ncbi:glycosyltransferase family 4 protein [Desulfogranum marinum]|uniref:glycosyltransferase family 4 protein n=1 Tax=Desulfogranum marinum TaxID=453220 RepID=UPI0019637A2F|nr:glycosyltransferase family 4 protein [Desulfogranum marinum]MBM9514813.1 glycosyltransferase family 4 protein [Desulfogranum marinum]
MRIFVTGTRGIPDIPGGVETHCQELYPIIAAMGHEVIVATRRPYVILPKQEWSGVLLEHIPTPSQKHLEAIVHTFLAIIRARLLNVDLLHIHAVGPGLLVPFARFLRLKVVFTDHGPDYDRQKWGGVAKVMLRLGEYLGGKFANEVIVISQVIGEIIARRCKRETNLVYNGVSVSEKSVSTDFLVQQSIIPSNYILAVARFVPEKGLLDLIKAFKQVERSCQLVIAGDADHETEYSRKVKRMAASDDRIILTGYITGIELNQVFSHAKLFVMPSYHEGLPIALLEAMSYRLPVLVSDIPANKEVALSPERFFRCGNLEELQGKMELLFEQGLSEKEWQSYEFQINEKYNWRKIAEQTLAVYKKVLQNSADR